MQSSAITETTSVRTRNITAMPAYLLRALARAMRLNRKEDASSIRRSIHVPHTTGGVGHTNHEQRDYGDARWARPVLEAASMSYEDARAELDDLVIEMTQSNHSWNQTQRLDKLRALAILVRRALKSAVGTSNEQERRNGIEAVLDRITSMMQADAQLQQIRESYRH